MPRDRTAREHQLSRRERQIMDVLLRRKQATATEVRAEIPEPPSYDAVRTTLRILTEKGHALRVVEGARHLYAPAIDLRAAREHALARLVRTFYQGSAARAALALLKRAEVDLDDDALQRIEEIIARSEQGHTDEGTPDNAGRRP